MKHAWSQSQYKVQTMSGLSSGFDFKLKKAAMVATQKDSREEVIQAWYMDDSDEDQRLPHYREPKEFVSLDQLAELGVLSWRLDADNYETDEELKKIREDRGYLYMDFCEVCPEKLPNYEEKIKNFFEEHLHTDEEIRYAVAGSGRFLILLHIRGMEDRLKRTEMKQQRMMSFLARAMRNPNFVQQLAEKKDIRKQLEDAMRKKRRGSIEVPSGIVVGELGEGGGDAFVKVESQYYRDIIDLDVSGLDTFAMGMKGTDENQMVHDRQECMEKQEEIGKDLSELFWEEFLNDRVDEAFEVQDVKEEDEYDVNVLVEQLGDLVSNRQ